MQLQTNATNALRSVKSYFKDFGISLTDAEDTFMYVLDITLEELLLGNHQLTNSNKRKIQEIVARRIKGEPTAYIIGQKFFWNHFFKVTKDTLIPRPETEILVAAVLEKIRKNKSSKKIKVLDLGTGSGCILISILKALKKDSYEVSGIGIDISSGAIDVAKYNAGNLDLSDDEIKFLCCDWNDLLKYIQNEKFDIIVGNPPYIPSNDISKLEVGVKDFEPHTALDGSDDGLECYRQIISVLSGMDIIHSIIAFEFGIGQSNAIISIMSGIGDFKVINDFANIQRIIISK